MTNIITRSHNDACNHKGMTVRIETIDLDTHKAHLVCGCVINFLLKENIITY